MSAAGVSGSSIVIIIIIDVAPFSAPSRPLFKRCCGDGDAAAVTSLGKRRLWEDVCNACGKQTMRGRRTNKHSTDSRNAPLRQMNGDAGVWAPEGVVRRGGVAHGSSGPSNEVNSQPELAVPGHCTLRYLLSIFRL